MIDPTDAILEIEREGNAPILPTPTGGSDGSSAQGNVDSPTVRMFAVFAVDVAIGAEQPVRANDVPDYWSVSLSSTATGTVSIWAYEQPAGPPLRLQAGGEAIIAGQGQSMFIRNTGPIVASLNVIAVRGYEGIRTRWAS